MRINVRVIERVIGFAALGIAAYALVSCARYFGVN